MVFKLIRSMQLQVTSKDSVLLLFILPLMFIWEYSNVSLKASLK